MHGSKPTTQPPRRGLARFWPFGRRAAAPSDDLNTDAVRVARQLHMAGRRVVGCLPASHGLPNHTLVHALALALARPYAATVAWLDLGAAYRSTILPEGEPVDDGSLVSSRWVERRLLWMAPATVPEAGMRYELVAMLLDELLLAREEPFDYVLVDLAGFEREGELIETIQHLQGVLVVARVGHTTRAELERVRDVVPPEHNLGVLLLR
jgi:hypothetical protein